MFFWLAFGAFRLTRCLRQIHSLFPFGFGMMFIGLYYKLHLSNQHEV
jgi:hypothetical protein